MTITASATRPYESVPSLPRDRSGRSIDEGDDSRETTLIDVTMFAGLLEDPAIALWAAEASERYRVTALGAIGLLAHALLVDGER
jgi:hypothetical protein